MRGNNNRNYEIYDEATKPILHLFKPKAILLFALQKILFIIVLVVANKLLSISLYATDIRYMNDRYTYVIEGYVSIQMFVYSVAIFKD